MDKTRVHELVTSLRQQNRTAVSEWESKEILRAWGLPVPACRPAKNVSEAVRLGRELGYPLVMKVLSVSIVHKSDVGGVKLNLTCDEDVERAYGEIRHACVHLDPSFRVLVQPMVEPGIEVILGASCDPQFGPALMFGVGGVLVELFRDVSFRLIPLKRKDAVEMISSIHAYPLLTGFRGKPGADIDSLVDMALAISDLVSAHPQIREIDLNPIVALPRGAAVADARMVLA